MDNSSLRLSAVLGGIPMCTYYAPLGTDLFLFCSESYFMLPLSNKNQADVIGAFNISRQLTEY